MNERSSRSHSVFTLRISGNNPLTSESCEGTLNLVDLAGSERLNSSGVASDKDRLRETQAINKSLSALGDVIAALGEKAGSSRDSHVPYRNSKLTYLLQNSLSGNSKTLVRKFFNRKITRPHVNIIFPRWFSTFRLSPPIWGNLCARFDSPPRQVLHNLRTTRDFLLTSSYRLTTLRSERRASKYRGRDEDRLPTPIAHASSVARRLFCLFLTNTGCSFVQPDYRQLRLLFIPPPYPVMHQFRFCSFPRVLT